MLTAKYILCIGVMLKSYGAPEPFVVTCLLAAALVLFIIFYEKILKML